MNTLYMKALKSGTALRTWDGRLHVNEALTEKVRVDFGVPDDYGIRFISRNGKTEAVLTPASAPARMAWKRGHISRVISLTGRGIDWATCYVKHASRVPRGLDQETILAVSLANHVDDVPCKLRDLYEQVQREYWGATYTHPEHA